MTGAPVGFGQVLFDGHAFEHPDYVGIWRYAHNLLTRVGGQIPVAVLLRSPASREIPPAIPVIGDQVRVRGRYDVVGRVRRKWAHLRLPGEARGAGLFHSLVYRMPPVDLPVVTTVYDLMHEQHFHMCTPALQHVIEEKRRAILAARVCICISHATAADLVRFYPEVRDRVRVTYLGYDHLPAPDDSRADRPSGAVLFVGERGQYKNFPLVLEAMTRKEWPAGIGLRVAGQPFSPAEVALVASLGLSDRVTPLGKIDDAALRSEYRRAAALVFPSKIEGFGLPILEAQANGCPVVCSDIPVFREVAGPSAILFDCRLAEKLAEAVVTALEPEVRSRAAEAGAENLRRFDWDRTARATLAVYREVLAESRGATA